LQELRDKPDWCYESGCPLAHIGKRFVLGSGDPTHASVAVGLEAPGGDEIVYDLLDPEPGGVFTPEECAAEIAVRRRDYPNLPRRFLTRGVALVGKSAFELMQWALPPVGLKRRDLFIDNTLRCLPPRNGDSNYPKGAVRKRAEACCRHYDRWDKRDGILLHCNRCGRKIAVYEEEDLLSLQKRFLATGEVRERSKTTSEKILLSGMSNVAHNISSELETRNKEEKPEPETAGIQIQGNRQICLHQNKARLSRGTPRNNGRSSGPKIAPNREGASQERCETRQSETKSSTSRDESSLWRGALSVLSEAFCNQVECKCGGGFSSSEFSGGFGPDVSIVSLHPAGIVREPTALWLQVKNFEKARDFAKRGLKVLVLAGGKAAKWWMGYAENVTKWQGHYEWNSQSAKERRAERLVDYSMVSLEKGRKNAKAKTAGGKRKKDKSGATGGGFIESLFGSGA
jgi:hypothetical protein